MSEPITLNASAMDAGPRMSGDPEPEAKPSVRVSVGVDRTTSHVILGVEIQDERDVKVAIRYTQQEMASLAMSMIKACQALDESKVSPAGLVLPPGAAKLQAKVKRPRR